MSISSFFKTGSGDVKRATREGLAAQEGRARNLTTLADNWYNDPAREAQVNDFMGALRTQLGTQTDRAFKDRSRQQKFATARSGLTTGAVDVTRQRRTLEDLFGQRVGNEGRVQDAGNSLRDQNRQTYQGMIDSAYGTADVGQNAQRRLLGAQANNVNSLETMWPNFVQQTGRDIAGAYQQGQTRGLYNKGMQAETPGFYSPNVMMGTIGQYMPKYGEWQ